VKANDNDNDVSSQRHKMDAEIRLKNVKKEKHHPLDSNVTFFPNGYLTVYTEI